MSEDESGDGEHDSLPTGKGDGSYDEGSWQAISVVRAANAATLAELKGAVSGGGAGLTASAAKGIIKFRNGADGTEGTADDRQLSSLEELDAIRYVGPVAFDRLLAYAFVRELAVSSGFTCTRPGEPNVTIEGTWQLSRDEWDLMLVSRDSELDSQFHDIHDCGRTVRQPSSSNVRYACYFEPEWTFFEPAFAISLPADARTRTASFSVSSVNITRDDRYSEGFREVSGTASSMTCTNNTPGT